MAEEFVDLYEVLELPVDADRNTLRKRINELYLDAQRNLDHRNFATRVKYQELFEVMLPQARYILLDDARRDEYNRLVHAFRAVKNGTPPPAPAASGQGFALEQPASPAIPDSRAPKVEAIPTASVDPETLAREREELWKKWKIGLEEVLSTEADDKPKSRSAATNSPSSFSAQNVPVPASSAPVAPQTPTPKAAARPKIDLSFASEGQKPPQGGPSSGAMETGREQSEPVSQDIEKRRTQHRRAIMKELLVNVGLVWGSIGAAIILVPGLTVLIALMGHYYPRVGAPLLKFPSSIVWGAGFLLIGGLTYFVSQALSKAMRRKKAQELALLSYEELLRQSRKS